MTRCYIRATESGAPRMTPESVLDYLLRHPGFFEQYADVIAGLSIPHPHSGRAISIHERQLVALRQRCRELEQQLGEWIATGRENDERGENLQRLVLAILAADGRPAQTQALVGSVGEIFAIPWVHLLEDASAEDWPMLAGESPEAGCGPVEGAVRERLTKLSGQPIGSAAWVPVRREGRVALLLLGSEDPERFPATAGTLYLRRIGEMLAVILPD